MKPTQVTELFATIKKTFVSFFSIFMFVALGVGVFLGISWAGPALQDASANMFREGQFHNFQIQFPLGLTDADLQKLGDVEGVTGVEGAHQSFQGLKKDGINNTVKVQSLGQHIDVPLVVEGELPSAPNEMAFHMESARMLGVRVGDSITFEHDAGRATDLDAMASIPGTSSPDGASAGSSNTSGMKYLMSDTFKVTAIIDTAEYVSTHTDTFGYSNSSSGAVDAIAWVPDAAFDASAFQNGFPIVNVTCESLSGMGTLSDEYKDASAKIEGRITAAGDTLGQARFESVTSAAKAKLEDAEKQLAEGKQKIIDGEKQLASGRIELATQKADGEKRLADAYALLQSYESQRAQGAEDLEWARSTVSQGESALATADSAKAEVAAIAADASAYKAQQDELRARGDINLYEYNSNLDAYAANLTSRLMSQASLVGQGVPIIDHTNYDVAVSTAYSLVDNFENMLVTYNGETMTVSQARARVADARAQLNSAEAEYSRLSAELDAGWAEYNAGQAELQRLVAEGEQKIADGERELAEAKAQVAENEPKIKAARSQFDALKSGTWAVMPRAYNAGVIETSTLSDVTSNLSISMAALFIIVGLLVSYFAVSRLVHEQVVQIGTKKALGFRQGEITRSYLLYSGIAVLAGAIVGAIVGYLVVEGIIGGVLATMFTFGEYPAYFGWGLFLIMTLLELGLILAATFIACRSILKEHATELLRGEKPPTGKTRFYEKWGIWEKLPLFVQTIVSNCVNDKRRMLSTIVGVAGSTALIVTAITLNNDVLKSYDAHYENVYGFNAITYVESDVDGAAANVEKVLQDEGAATSQVLMKRYLMRQPDGSGGAMRIVVPLDETAFKQIYHINPLNSGTVDLSAKGAWVTRAYADHLGAKVGDVVTIDGGDGTTHEVPILGFYEFWLTYHEMVMGPDYYQEEFGKDAMANAVLAQTGNVSVNDLVKPLSGVEGFDSIVPDAQYQHLNFETFSSVSGAVVAIYLVLAILMAIVVLLNLNTMFIDEKKRELIVLMINGFSVKDAKHYVSYDSIVLTAIGVIVGIILGCIMGSITVNSIEPSTGVFIKGVDFVAVVAGFVGSAVLAFIMSKIALRRVDGFELTDINRQ